MNFKKPMRMDCAGADLIFEEDVLPWSVPILLFFNSILLLFWSVLSIPWILYGYVSKGEKNDN